jgi:hypothetical protein
MLRTQSWWVAGALALALTGCAVYPETYYYPGGAGAYATNGYNDGYDDGYRDDGYQGGDYYYGQPSYYGGAYGWPYYYSVLYPSYASWYDPFWSPYYYYGITYFPSTWFGFGIGYWDAWPYYHAYSPYPYSFWGGYYNWYDYPHGHHGHHGHDDRYGNGHWREDYDGGGRYGSARNEAERIAHLMGADRAQGTGKADQQARTTGDWRDSARTNALALAPRDYGRTNWRGRSRGIPESQSGYAGHAGPTAPATRTGARGQAERWPGAGTPRPLESTTYAPRGRTATRGGAETYVYPQERSAGPGPDGSVAPMPRSRGAGAGPYYRGRSSAPQASMPERARTGWQGEPGPGYDAGPSPRYRGAPGPRYESAPQARYGAPPAGYDAPRGRTHSAPAPAGAPAPNYQAPAQGYQAPAPSYQAPAPRGDYGGRGGSSGRSGGSSGGSARGQSGRSSGGSRDRSHSD